MSETKTHSCFWCQETQNLLLIEGAYFCQEHGVCALCGTRLDKVPHPIACVCAEYGAYGHDDDLYCNLSCLEAAHPDVEPPDEEVET